MKEALRLSEIREPAHEAVSALGELPIAALARIGDHPAAGDLAGGRLQASLIGAPFVPASLASMIGAPVLTLATSLVIAGLVVLALLLVRRSRPPSFRWANFWWGDFTPRDSPGPMKLTVKTKNAVICLSPRGRIDHDTSAEFKEALMSHIEGQEDAVQVLVSCAEVDYINSEGLRVLLIVSQRLAKKKGALALCGVNERIREVLKISGFDRIVPITETEADALKRLHP